MFKVTETRVHYVLAETEEAATTLIAGKCAPSPDAVVHAAKPAGRVPAEMHKRPLHTAGEAAASQGEALDMLLGRSATIADWLDIERRRAGSAPKAEAPAADGAS